MPTSNQSKHSPIRISWQQWNAEFNPEFSPAITIKSGDRLVAETRCCSKGAVTRRISTRPETFRAELNYTPGMPLTGPVAVEGALPGDTLMIEITDIAVADTGWTMATKGKGAIRDLVESAESRMVSVAGDTGLYDDRYRIPIRPMIGCIGTTPPEAINAGWPGEHGGNIDCKDVAAGSTLFLPVYVPGANLALGDLHAVQGDGEVGCAGVEIGGEVSMRITRLRGAPLPLPFLVTPNAYAVLVTAATLDEAAKQAVERMTVFLAERTELSLADAGMLLSLVGDIRICQIVDPAMTCRMEIPRDFVQNELKFDLPAYWNQFVV